MAKRLLDSDGSDCEDNGSQNQLSPDLGLNEEFARKFAYNKEREELHRLEDKFGRDPAKLKRLDKHKHPSATSDEDTSDSEEEDDAGELATEALDSEILATLNAIKSKDPRVYDKNVTFYAATGDEDTTSASHGVDTKREKPMFLRDYHRENLLNGPTGDSKAEDEQTPLTYHEEQDALKRSIVGEINAAVADDGSENGLNAVESEGDQDHDNFLVAKPERKRKRGELVHVDIEQADKDPGAFLSNFMAARAWIPTERSEIRPLESDDEEEDRRADEFEEAYNLRFEDPGKSNEKLVSHGRDTAAKYSVRREEKNPRKKNREAEGERKAAAEQERAQEKVRLRKLKIKEAEEKLRKIKKAAGHGVDKELSPEQWAKFFDDDWDDAKWEEEMRKRFDDTYYAQEDLGSDEDAEGQSKKRKKPKKPKWDDDIDIQDLIPDFREDGLNPQILDEEKQNPTSQPVKANSRHQKSIKERAKGRQEKKMEARREKQVLEQVVDKHLEFDSAIARSQERSGVFRYRESSPLSFGLSARDILMAKDSQLNEFAGLKKLAPFRDSSKKRLDQKRLGKKTRLRQWRKETFGDENGPGISTTTKASSAPKTTVPTTTTAATGMQEDGNNGAEAVKDVQPDADTRRPAKKR